MKKYALLILILLFFTSTPRVQAADLKIDFSQVIGPAERHATGFEWIFPMNNEAMRPYITQLKPNIIKDPWSEEQTARSFGTKKIQWLVGNYYVVNLNKRPWENYNDWESYISNYVTTHVSNSQSYEWIIFQEPDHYTYNNTVHAGAWSGNDEQFFEAWKHAYQTIKHLRPNDAIVGPSPVYFHESFLHDFLLFAKENQVLPDILSWHELFPIGDAPLYNIYGYSPDLIPGHVASINQFMQEHGISISKFNITEYQGEADNYRPGPAAAFIADIERARIEGTKGNWAVNNDPAQISGLVTDPNNPQPRSLWWVYKTYAEMTGKLVATTFQSNTNGFGSFDNSKQTAMVLAGNQGFAGTKTVELYNVPHFDPTNNRIDIFVDKIPNSERSKLTSPVRVARYDSDFHTNPITVVLPEMGAWDAYVITLSQHIPGDFNYDHHIDIDDITFVTSGFGNPYTIFDYNTVIENFGK